MKDHSLIELRTMLSYNSQSLLKRRIVELKAVDNNYPYWKSSNISLSES